MSDLMRRIADSLTCQGGVKCRENNSRHQRTTRGIIRRARRKLKALLRRELNEEDQ